MRRDTQNVLLVLLGGALVKIAWTDLYLRYVRPGNRWYLLAAGMVILGLAAFGLVRDAWSAHRLDRSPATAPALSHGHGEPHTPWLILVPVLAVFLVAPPALGAESVARGPAGNSVAGPTGGGADAPAFPPLPAGGVPELRLSDFVSRAVWEGDAGTATGLAGREVLLTGFLARDRSGGVVLARMVITCCAADARPMLTRLVGRPDLQPGGWVHARVRLLPGSATPADGYLPAAQLIDIEPVPAPAEPYEY